MKKEAGVDKDKDKEVGGEKKKAYNFSKGSNRFQPNTTKFEGKVDALKNFYYDCTDSKQSDMFTKTTKEIAGYVGRTYKCGGNIRTAIENEEAPKFAIPDDVADEAGKGAVRMWEKSLMLLPRERIS